MGWAKFSDDCPENEHILALAPATRWFWAASIMATRGYKTGTSAFVSRTRAEALARQQNVPLKVIKELEASGRWEPTEGGWNIHDYEDFLPSRREEASAHEPDPAKRAAGLKSAAQRQQTGNSAATHVEVERQQAASEVATPRARGRRDPVPVPEPSPKPETLKAPPVPPTRRLDAQNGYDDATTELAVGIQNLLGRALSTVEILECQGALNQYAYLTVKDLLDRAREHQEYCDTHGMAVKRTVVGFSDTWRRENDHRADQGHPKASRVHLGRTTGMTSIGDIVKHQQEVGGS